MTDVTVHINAYDHDRLRYATAHLGGRHSLHLADGHIDVYLAGTPDELRAFAAAIVTLADEVAS